MAKHKKIPLPEIKIKREPKITVLDPTIQQMYALREITAAEALQACDGVRRKVAKLAAYDEILDEVERRSTSNGPAPLHSAQSGSRTGCSPSV
jgi:hypothetical protein